MTKIGQMLVLLVNLLSKAGMAGFVTEDLTKTGICLVVSLHYLHYHYLWDNKRRRKFRYTYSTET
jgi:hypothetical protein